MARFRLAQVNIARMRAPLDDPLMEGFAGRLDEINALADASPGFVWRLQSDDGDATALRVFDDESILINMSVWESVEALRTFAYHTTHRELLQGREQWFEQAEGPYLALWWIPVGTEPAVEDAKERLSLLAEKGPSPDSFTFAKPYPPPARQSA